MKFIALTQDKFAIVDDQDFDKLNQWKWYAKKDNNMWYALRHERMENGKQKTIQMHRLLMNAKNGQLVDHINRDGLDNQIDNLRICTNAQNQHNSNKQIGKRTSNFHTRDKRWRSAINEGGKIKHLGSFDTEEQAALAYNKRALDLRGEYANLNIIENV